MSLRSIETDYSTEDVKQLLYDCGGIIADVARKIGCTRHCIYNYLERHPELVEHKDKAAERLGDYECETSYKVLGKLLKRVKEDPTTAFQAAKLIATRSRKSRYYEAPKATETDTDQKVAYQEAREYFKEARDQLGRRKSDDISINVDSQS